MLLLSIHPVLQCIAILLTCYNFMLGIQRFRVLHLKQKNVHFDWKQHVLFGKIALVMLMSGALGGMTIVYLHWYRVLMAGIHAEVALVIIPLAIFGLLSGWYMDSKKKKRTFLPIIHGLNNLILLLLALIQVASGLRIYTKLVFGN